MLMVFQSTLPGSGLTLPDNLDSIIETKKSFLLKKHDISTTVGILMGKDFGFPCDLLVKRFNYRGFFDFLAHKISKDRAKRLWEKNLELYNEGLPVPKPIAFIESSLKHRNSFFISSVISDAERLSHLYRNGKIKNKGFTMRLAETIAGWHLKGAVHGDLKWPNILVQENENTCKIYLVDLDQSRLYPEPSISGIIKDLKRFYRFGLELGAETWVDAEFFDKYMEFIPDRIRNMIDPALIRNAAFKEWCRKGKKRL